MIKRALLTGVGNRYAETGPDGLSPLNLLGDLTDIAARLGITDWDSIDHIDDNTFTAHDPVTVRIIDPNTILPDKPNILRSIAEILNAPVTTDLFLFYYSGHGLSRNDLYMVVYDAAYFEAIKKDSHSATNFPPSSTLITANEYIDLINAALEKNAGLTVLSVIDCCFAGAIIDDFTAKDQFAERHIIFCAVDATQEANDNGFTKALCQAAAATNTYLKLNNIINNNAGSPAPLIYIPQTLNDKITQF